MIKFERGFVPLVILLLVAVIGSSAVFVSKNLPFNQPQATPDKGFEGSSSAVLTANNPTSTPSSKKSATTKPTSSVNPTSRSTNTPASTPSTSSSPTATPTPTPIPSTSFSNDNINVSLTCSGSSMSVAVSGSIPSSSNYSEGTWGAIVDNTTGNKMIYVYVGNQNNFPTNIAANFPPTQAIRGSNISIIADGRPYSVRAYYAPYTTGMPSLGEAIASVNFSKSCP